MECDRCGEAWCVRPHTQFPCGATTLAYVSYEVNGEAVGNMLCNECIHLFNIICIYGYADDDDDDEEEEEEEEGDPLNVRNNAAHEESEDPCE